MVKSLAIGLGTGRCGTRSLAILLNAQRGFCVTHENPPLLPWLCNFELLRQKLTAMQARVCSTAGDVAHYYLPYVERLIELVPNVRFICLQRDKAATINSFLKKLPKGNNRWSEHPAVPNDWDRAFPKYPQAHSIEDAIGRHWEAYYSTARSFQQRWPQQFVILGMSQALNTEAGFRRICDFLHIPTAARVRRIGIRTNTS